MNIITEGHLKQTEQLCKHLRLTSVFEDEKSTEAKTAVLKKLNETIVKEFVKDISMKRVNYYKQVLVLNKCICWV